MFNFALFHSVLNKVSKYRGMNRDKNELNAAFWFTQPGLWSYSNIYIFKASLK